VGRKSKPDEPETYEVWLCYATDGWKRVEERDNDGVFDNQKRALLIAESKSHGKGVVETMVVARRPIAVFNGEAIGMKHRLNAVSKKEEGKTDGEVHGDRTKEGDVQDPGAQLGSEAAPGGAGREGAPKG
jgi:hypothetical protein